MIYPAALIKKRGSIDKTMMPSAADAFSPNAAVIPIWPAPPTPSEPTKQPVDHSSTGKFASSGVMAPTPIIRDARNSIV
jgi:hypothetical protein